MRACPVVGHEWMSIEERVLVSKVMRGAFEASSTMETIMKEVSMLAKLRHPRIVLLMGHTKHSGQFAMVLEWVERGNLFDILHGGARESKEHNTMSTGEKLRIAKDVADGMMYLHCQKIIHKDLKSPNILIERGGRAKVSNSPLCHAHACANDSNACASHFRVTLISMLHR